VKSGEWLIHVETTNEKIKTEDSITEETEEEETEENSQAENEISEITEEDDTENSESENTAPSEPFEEVESFNNPSAIGKVNVKVEGSYEEVGSIEGEIEVAENIAGLFYYMKDDGLMVEWTDNNVGNVNLNIVDSKTKEVIDNVSVSDRSYYCEFDTNVHPEIILTVVQSTSSSITGAEKHYKIDATNKPDATVTFDDITITNQDVINAHLVLGKNYSTEIFINDKKIGTREDRKAGECDVEVPLSEGPNNIKLYVIDPDTGDMRSTPFLVEKDTVPVTFRMANLFNNEVTKKENVTFEGEIDSDYNTFTVNDTDIAVEGDHTFKYEYSLKEGENHIVFVATDIAGNVTSVETVITRVIPKGIPIPIKIGVGLLLLIIILLVYQKISGREIISIDKIKKFFKPAPRPRQERRKPPRQPKEKESIDARIKRLGIGQGFSIPRKIFDGVALVFPVIFMLVFFLKVVFGCTCASASMEPTLNVGSTTFYNRLAYVKHGIERGDIVSFKSDEYGSIFAKRVIGIPGDEISFKDGYVVINGMIADESDYLDSDIETNCERTFTVPENTVFVLGDNREDSYDSRFWQNPYIPQDKIIGKFMGAFPFSVANDIVRPVLELFGSRS